MNPRVPVVQLYPYLPSLTLILILTILPRSISSSDIAQPATLTFNRIRIGDKISPLRSTRFHVRSQRYIGMPACELFSLEDGRWVLIIQPITNLETYLPNKQPDWICPSRRKKKRKKESWFRRLIQKSSGQRSMSSDLCSGNWEVVMNLRYNTYPVIGKDTTCWMYSRWSIC